MEPQERLGLARLTKMAFDGIDLMPLRAELLSRTEQEEYTDGLFMDLSVIDQLYGNAEMGLAWQAKALSNSRLYATNRRTNAQPKLLVFAEASHVGGNTPIEFLLETSDFEIITYYPDLTPGAPNTLPEHDVAFCAVPTDSAVAQPFFDTVRALTAESGVPTFNLPDGPVDLDRDALVEIFPYVRGLRFPTTKRISRDELIGALIAESEPEIFAGVGDYPCIIRPVGSHAGLGLEKVDDRNALVDYLTRQAATEFFVSEFVDYATLGDGQFRKYRIVFVNGRAFPCHMAIADQWDVWYLNAKMDEHPEKRAEEALWMAEFDSDFATRHRHAFEALTTGVGLNYFGIDCAEDRDGNLVVFEADNALIVHDMDSDTVFPYKSKHMHRIFDAFEGMLRADATTSMTNGAGGVAH